MSRTTYQVLLKDDDGTPLSCERNFEIFVRYLRDTPLNLTLSDEQTLLDLGIVKVNGTPDTINALTYCPVVDKVLPLAIAA